MANGNNIARFREDRGWSRPTLAKRMNTSPQQIERLEKGQRQLTLEWMNRAAQAFGVTPTQIIETGVELPPEAASTSIVPSIVAADDTVLIQRLDLSLSMGPGTLIDDWVEAEPVNFDLSFVRSITRTPPDRLRLVTGIGDSMYPTISWGDLLMIDTTDRQLARQDGVYWIDLYGAAGIKRLRTVAPGRVLVISDNPAVGDQEVSAEDLRIQGRAIWLARGI